jgi:hypothetical protein
MWTAVAGNFATHADMAVNVFNGSLERGGQFGNRQFGDIGAGGVGHSGANLLRRQAAMLHVSNIPQQVTSRFRRAVRKA